MAFREKSPVEYSRDHIRRSGKLLSVECPNCKALVIEPEFERWDRWGYPDCGRCGARLKVEEHWNNVPERFAFVVGVEQQTVTCPECVGTGLDRANARAFSAGNLVRCPCCGGIGSVTAATPPSAPGP